MHNYVQMHERMDLKIPVYYINIFFTAFFAFEAVMKIIVLTPPVSTYLCTYPLK